MDLRYRKAGGSSLEAFTDASYEEDKDDGQSVSGTVAMFGEAAFCRSSKAQVYVMLSSVEAEYLSPADYMEDVFHLRMLLEFTRPDLAKMRGRISEDNGGAVGLASNPICTIRTRHIDVHHHSLRETIEQGKIK